MESADENYFGRQTFNLCELVGFANCNFELNKSNTKEAVNHLVSQHDCIRSKSERFQIKLSNFKSGMTPPRSSSNNQIHIWTPIIANLNKKQGFLFIMAFLNGASFGTLALYLPCKNDENWALTALPGDVEFITMTGESSKYSFVQNSTTLAKLDESGLSSSPCFQSSTLNQFLEVDGSLLVTCQIRHHSKTESSAIATPWKVELGRKHAIPLEIKSHQVKKAPNFAQIKIWSKKALQTMKTGISFLRHIWSWKSLAFLFVLIAYVVVNLNLSFEVSLSFSAPLDSEILYRIVRQGDLEVFQKMLKMYPSFTNSTFFGHTQLSLLQMALLDQNHERGFAKVKFVVEEMGADLEHRDKHNISVLHLASGTNHAAALEFFLEKGLNPNIQNSEGFTPFENLMLYFINRRTKSDPDYGWDAIKLLFKYGADCKYNKKSVVSVRECLRLRDKVLTNNSKISIVNVVKKQ